MEVRIGTSGWSYPSGAGTRDGIVSPERGRGTRPREFDQLAYYAEHFDTVEVNSTFYRPPSAAVTRRWVERTPPGFVFSRNAETWWQHDAAEQRYDYLYTDAELAPFARTADAARRLVKKLCLYLNNHFAAKAVANAVSLKAALGEPITGDDPRAFVERYPQVRDHVQMCSEAEAAMPSSFLLTPAS